MNLVTWDPYRELGRLPSHFNRVFGALAPRERDEELSLGAWIPPVDIMEEKDRILLTAELPGFRESDVEVQMEGNVLTLRGERKFDSDVKKEGYHRVERAYGSFGRSFTLPTVVDTEKIKAEYKDGVLRVTLPKREEAKPKQIQISVAK